MIEIILRKMMDKDIPDIYKYIHLNYVKKYYPDNEKEQWEAHRRWYSFVINSPSYLFYTIESLSREFLGTVKFELDEKEAAISVYLVKEIRGKGYSETVIINSINELCFEKPHIKKISAYILEENEISQKVFLKIGFKRKKIEEYNGTEHILFEKKVKALEEKIMTKKEKVKKILEKLHEKFGDPKCALDFKTPFELLVAVILSAQCTDVRVNIVTKEMYKKVNTPEGFAALPVEKIEEMIKSTGFFRNKAKNIKLCSQQLLSKYNGEIPKDMDKLIELAGVGRKTANVVRGEVWGLADGITVDTHVKRLSNLIGLVKNDDPVKIEQELMKIVPKKDWIDFSHYLILQGRDKCIARRPKCNECEIKELCYHGKNIDK